MENYLIYITKYLWAQSWQIAALAVIITVISILLRNKSAHIRYLLWLILLAKCIVPPLLTVPLAILPQEQTGAPVIETAAKISTAIKTTVHEPVAPLPALVESTTFDKFRAITMNQWLCLAWILGVVVFALIIGIKAIRLNHWLKHTRRSLGRDQQRSIGDLFTEINEEKFPKIWQVDGIGQPFVWGLLRGDI